MNVISAKKLKINILRFFLSLSAIISIVIFIWGRIDFSISVYRFRVGHPNEVLLLMLILISVYFYQRHGITIRSQIDRARYFFEQNQNRVPAFLVVFACIYLARIKLLQHFTFHTGAYDLAMYDNAVRNTLNGNFMFADQLGRNFFSEHFSPILLVLCPLYLIANTPVTALLAEAFSAAAGLWFVYKIARHYSLSPIIATLVSLIFLNYKYFARGIMFDFHPEMMEPTLLLGCIYFMLKCRWSLYFAFLLMAISCKEDVVIYTFCFGLYCLFRRHTRYVGLATCVLSLIWALIAWCIIIPGAMPQTTEVSHFVSARWGHIGDGYLEVALNLLKRPFYVLGRVLSAAPIEMLFLLGFVPLLGFEVLLLAVPGLVLNTTTTFDMQAKLQVHYAAPIIPFVFWAFILGLVRIRRLLKRFSIAETKIGQIKYAGVILLTLLTCWSFGANYDFYAFTPNVLNRYRIMKKLESNATVSCETGFVPHLSRCNTPYIFPYEANRKVKYRDCDYVLVDKKGNPWPLQRMELELEIENLINDIDSFQIIAQTDDIYLFRNLLIK